MPEIFVNMIINENYTFKYVRKLHKYFEHNEVNYVVD